MQTRDLSNSVKIVMCGGRHGAAHIRTHLDCSEGHCHSLILDSSVEDSKQYLKSTVLVNRNYTYIHLPGMDFYERINIVRPYIINYEYVTLVAVDDLISDASILEILSQPVPPCTQYSRKPLVKGFGPDISYLPRDSTAPGRLFSMPKQSPVSGALLSAGQYWDSIRRLLSLPDPTTRLFGLICETGFFPFFYSTYFSDSLYEVLRCHKHALEQLNIQFTDMRSSILLEYVVVAISALSSSLYITKQIYRLNNYVCNSAGSDSSYSHRSLAFDWADNQEAFYYFHYFANAYCADRDVACSLSLLLNAAYQCLSVHSLHLACAGVSSPSLLQPSSPYQVISKSELLSSEHCLEKLSLFKTMLFQWHE